MKTRTKHIRMVNLLCLVIAITALMSINMSLLADETKSSFDTIYHFYEGISKEDKENSEIEVFKQYISDSTIKSIHMKQYRENQWYDNIAPKPAKIDINDMKIQCLCDMFFTLSDGENLHLGKEFIVETSAQNINKWVNNGGKKFPLGVFVNNKDGSTTYATDNLFAMYFNTVTYEVFLSNLKQGYIDIKSALNS